MTVSSATDTSDLEKYVNLGLAVLPIWGITAEGTCACPAKANCTKGPGKHPLDRLVPNGVKGASRNLTLIRQWLRSYPDANWAVRCGEPMSAGGFLVVLDVDPRNGGDISLAQFPSLPDTATQETGGNGHHYFFKTKEPVRGRGVGPGLDLQGENKYVLIAPSRHVSGGRYVWAVGASLDDVPIAEAPTWLLEGADAPGGGRPPRVGEGTARDTVLGEAFAQADMLGMDMGDGTVAVKCPWADLHSDARGRGEDSSTVILPPAGGSHFGGFKCMHEHCANRKWHDVRNALPASAVAAANLRFPLRPVAVVNREAEDQAAPERPRDPMQVCKEKLLYKQTKSGGFVLKSDLVNAITILSYDPRWQGVIAFDEFAQSLRFMKTPPWHPDDAPKRFSPIWTDEDATRMDAWFRRYWALELPVESIGRAAYLVGKREMVNPLRDWMDELVWDGAARLDRWLHTYLGAEDTDYNRWVGAKWVISAVARVYKPGCKADHLLVLEGRQGRGKSTALRVLAGESYFSDTPIDIGNKDAYVALKGKLVIELAELASLGKADLERIKAFFTSPVDNYRPPYGRENIAVPRSCVFAGTVNLGEYLRDETGNRRYWPVACGIIDIPGLEADREQIWAEAVHRYRAGERWWPEGPSERQMLELEQEQREIGDIWEAPVAEWLGSKDGQRLHNQQGYVTAVQILTIALDFDVSRCGRNEQTRLGGVMKKLGATKVRAGRHQGRGYAYTLNPSAQAGVRQRVSHSSESHRPEQAGLALPPETSVEPTS